MSKSATEDFVNSRWAVALILPFIALIGAFTLATLGSYNDVAFSRAFITFAVWGSLSLVGGILFFFAKRHLSKDKKNFWDKLFYLHEPDEAISSLGKKYLIRNPFALFFFSLSIFWIFMFISSFNQMFYAGVMKFTQSGVTNLANVLFNTIVPPFGENFSVAGWGLGIILFLTLIIIMFIIKKLTGNKNAKITRIGFFLIAILVAAPLFGFGVWKPYHNMRYGADSIAGFVTGSFGTVMAETVILSGSVIPAFVMHAVNNYYSSMYQSGILFNSSIIFLNVLLEIFWLFMLYVSFKNKWMRRLTLKIPVSS